MLPPNELQRLLIELELRRGIVLVRADTVLQRREMLRWLRENVTGSQLCVIVFSGGKDPIEQALEASKQGIVVGTGVEILSDVERLNWLRMLNAGRDRLAQLETSLVLLLDDEAMNDLAQQAPDFWSWHGGIYEGEREAEVMVEGTRHPLPGAEQSAEKQRVAEAAAEGTPERGAKGSAERVAEAAAEGTPERGAKGSAERVAEAATRIGVPGVAASIRELREVEQLPALPKDSRGEAAADDEGENSPNIRHGQAHGSPTGVPVRAGDYQEGYRVLCVDSRSAPASSEFYTPSADTGWSHTLRSIQYRLEVSRDTEWIFVAGPRGAGCSTALSRLGEVLTDYHVARTQGLPTSSWPMELMVLRLAFGTYGSRERLYSDPTAVEDSLDELVSWLNQASRVHGLALPWQLRIGRSRLPRYAEQLFTAFQRQGTPGASRAGLLDRARHVLLRSGEAIRSSGKPGGMAYIFDVMDTLELEQALSLARDLLAFFKPLPSTSLVMAVPIELAVRPLPAWMKERHNTLEVLEPVNVEADAPNREFSVATLRGMLHKRLHEDWFTPAARDLLIEASGGLPGKLLELTREALVNARGASKQQIDEPAVHEAIAGSIRQIRRLLTLEDIDILQQTLSLGLVPTWTPRALDLLRQGFLILTPSRTRQVTVPLLVRRALPPAS